MTISSTSATPALPSALTEHVGFLAVCFGQRAQRKFRTALEPLGIRPTHFDYLATIGEFGPLSQKDLAARLRTDAARIVSATDELEDMGAVVRSVDSVDRRRNLVQLTPNGRALLTRARKAAALVEADLVAQLSDHEATTMRRLLQTVLGFEPVSSITTI